MFTEKELRYAEDTDFLLTKATISQKVQALLNQTHDQLKQYLAVARFTFPEGTRTRAGKIARGENYQQLPYQLLDYPRLFTREDVFALRTMFWWGQFFSVTFQLGGESWQRYRPAILRHAGELTVSGASLCIGDDPWQHHRERSYYQPVRDMSPDVVHERMCHHPFLKVAIFLPIEEGTSLPDRALYFFQCMVRMIELT